MSSWGNADFILQKLEIAKGGSPGVCILSKEDCSTQDSVSTTTSALILGSVLLEAQLKNRVTITYIPLGLTIVFKSEPTPAEVR